MKKLQNWIFPDQKAARKKRTFSQKSRPFLDGQEKSNFQFFATKICRSFENILNYPNINCCEKILKIGFYLAKKLDRHLQWR